LLFYSECFGGENGQMVGNILEQTQGKQSAPTEQRDLTEQELEEQDFINAILVDNEDVWTKIFQENNMTYEEPNMVLFSGAVNTEWECNSDSGPFYCPDQKVYMDYTF
jgi:predicted metalloprotease